VKWVMGKITCGLRWECHWLLFETSWAQVFL